MPVPRRPADRKPTAKNTTWPQHGRWRHCPRCANIVSRWSYPRRLSGYEGAGWGTEAQEAASAIKVLGGKLSGIDEWQLPPVEGEAAERKILRIQKISPTPDRFPRQAAKIAKQPL